MGKVNSKDTTVKTQRVHTKSSTNKKKNSTKELISKIFTTSTKKHSPQTCSRSNGVVFQLTPSSWSIYAAISPGNYNSIVKRLLDSLDAPSRLTNRKLIKLEKIQLTSIHLVKL